MTLPRSKWQMLGVAVLTASVLLGMAAAAFGRDVFQNWWILVGSPSLRRRGDGNSVVTQQRGAQGLSFLPVTLRELLAEILVWVEVNTSEQANLAVWGEFIKSFPHCNRVINVQWILTHQRHLCVWMHLSAKQSLSEENSTGKFFKRGTSAQVSLSQSSQGCYSFLTVEPWAHILRLAFLLWFNPHQCCHTRIISL